MRKAEQITASQLNKVVSPHCDKCGSTDLMCDARARWDMERARWYNVEVDEEACVCCCCGRDVQIKWRLS